MTYHYHYDGSDLIRITNDNGQTVWTSDKPNTVTNQNGDPFYYVTNYRGYVIRIVDENGTTVANYSYDPWGKVLSVSENAAVTGQPIGYARGHQTGGIPTNVVEDVMKNGTSRTVIRNGAIRIIYKHNGVRVATEERGKIVIAPMRYY
ncbi:hypothetical protein PNH38_10385 [Anoxybacillus rupiensis]|uniref:Teneurin-like YD-shell domain-containing protein n=1 Tax=Anoxybacteroides rupiense TaxID=311460 RepID=A0ABT5W4Q3_9BACL|nr:MULTISPECIES: hypothetical protein [Anoxybacillus]MDE8564284.1 hypothetical protein [Anoxybacillus rupiensis]